MHEYLVTLQQILINNYSVHDERFRPKYMIY